MKKTEIQTAMKLWELNFSAGDFLVIHFSVDKKQTKVVRYSDTKKYKVFNLMEKCLPLYLSNILPKYICENKPFDISLAEK